MIIIIITIIIAYLSEKTWFHVHGKVVQVSFDISNRVHASTLNKNAAAWEHTSPHLYNEHIHNNDTLITTYSATQVQWPNCILPSVFSTDTHACFMKYSAVLWCLYLCFQKLKVTVTHALKWNQSIILILHYSCTFEHNYISQ